MIEVDPKGVARVVDPAAVKAGADRQLQREETARRTSTPDGLLNFMAEHGDKEGARRLHDAMFRRY